MASQLNWIVREFAALTPQELYAVARLRIAVFILEQRCFYEELDNKDQECLHVMAFEAGTGNLAAYSRIVPPGISYREPAIGRVITSMDFRGRKLGMELMERSIALTHQAYPGQAIRIGAQAHLQQFYSTFGFVSEGEIYDEDGIDHVEMILKPN